MATADNRSALGRGGTPGAVCIVDAFDDPNAESDPGVYRSHYGLPACTAANGCFKKVNQKGETKNCPTAEAGWVANNRVQEFSSAGAFVATFGSPGSGSGQLQAPKGVAVNSSGRFFVADTANNRAEEWAP